MEGGGKLAVWGNPRSRLNIDAVLLAGMPCDVECDVIPPQGWAITYGHSYWVPEGNTLIVTKQQGH